LKVKLTDAQRAGEILRRDFLRSTGLDSDALSVAETTLDLEAETAVCPACSTRFTPTQKSCPECGLQFF
jgi:rRNA maturation endonuclease Nob1